jgi:hypothetical protein
MGITKLKQFAGEAEILGEVRPVWFSDEHAHLVIGGVDLNTANAILDNLALGTLTVVSHTKVPTAPKPSTGNGATAMHTSAPLAQPPVAHVVPEKKPEPTPVAATGDVATDLADAKKMLDVVNYFFERGIKDADAIAAECEKVKMKVPVLSRVGDMRDRVARTMVAAGIGEPPSA